MYSHLHSGSLAPGEAVRNYSKSFLKFYLAPAHLGLAGARQGLEQPLQGKTIISSAYKNNLTSLHRDEEKPFSAGEKYNDCPTTTYAPPPETCSELLPESRFPPAMAT
jgi:hypothetical protein